MRRYSYEKNRKSRKEKVGFFTALSICIIAVGLAIGSAYASIGGFDNRNVTDPTYIATLTGGQSQGVGNDMTGVTVEETVTEAVATTVLETELLTEPTYITEPVTEATAPSHQYTGDNNSLQTILQVSASLEYPVVSRTILREYSEEPVQNKTMQEYRAHTGIDIEANIGENVMAMSDGVVEEIYKDDLYGNVIRVKNGNFSVLYCGVSDTQLCAVGEQITAGSVIAQVGEIPCESSDPMHIHIEVRVGDKSIDPLTVISNDE